MSNQTRNAQTFTTLTFALVLSVSAQAGATRTFVSTTGNDSNTSANCGPSAPCRTFTAALSVTNSGGEVVVLTSGGYGPATISQPVVITATGIDASISVTTSGGTGLTINTPGNVTLIGLNLHGEGIGVNGVEIQKVGFLRLYNMLIENFISTGIDFEASGGKMSLYNSAINDNVNDGLLFNVSGQGYVEGSSFDHNFIGVQLNAGQVTIADSDVHNGAGGFFTNDGTLVLFNDSAEFNQTALASQGGGSLYFARCLIANNTSAYDIALGSTMAGTAPGTSLIAPGQGTTGTLSTPIALH